MGRNFFNIPNEERSEIKILETGCGSGANLWMIAREGFNAYGVDISQESLNLCEQMLNHKEVSATLQLQDMSQMIFPENSFNAVVDIFSSYCLTKEQSEKYLNSIKKILKRGGVFFSYFPSKRSDAYQFPENAEFIDTDTLSSITRKDAAFFGQNYPFRFIHPKEYESKLREFGFEVRYCEIVGRTYNKGQEYFEFVVIEAQKV